MRANSRPVSSNQHGIHEHLAEIVDKHASSEFRKPIAAVSEQAFQRAIAAWQAHGGELIIDAGCGVGLSTRRLATMFRESFVIGVDQSADRLQRDVHWPGLPPENFLTVRADLIDFWRLMLSEAIHPVRHYLLYPNPWPKKAHVGRRWHGHPVFPTIMGLGGLIECRSNWKTYVDEFAAAAMQLRGKPIATNELVVDPNSALSPFEEKYLASGHALWCCTINLRAGE
jgi:tRNA G46 methylase TrmB